MRSPDAIAVRGWCPGALQPMQSGDGLIVRVRPRTGRLDLAALKGLAEAGQRFGNGHIDVTRRANLQLRGVSEATLVPLQQAIGSLGLLDETPAVEAVRNIVISPLAGLDPKAPADARPLSDNIAGALARDRRLWQLPGKFCFTIDDGSAISLAGERSDITLSACRDKSGHSAWLLGADSPDGAHLFGITAHASAVDAATRLALAFLDLAEGGWPRRMRDVPVAMRERLWRSVSGIVQPIADEWLSAPVPSNHRIGRIAGSGGDVLAVGLGVPFGRIEAHALTALARGLEAAGIDQLRLSPWRVLYTPIANGEPQVREVIDLAREIGLIVDRADPLLRVHACPGTPSCLAALIETRALARRLSALLDGDLMDRQRIDSVHISGCAKGCACSAKTDIVVVGKSDGYAVAFQCDARAPAQISIPYGADPCAAIAALVSQRPLTQGQP